MNKELLREAPDGYLSDEELEAELEAQRQEFERQLQARREANAAAKKRAEEEAAARAEQEAQEKEKLDKAKAYADKLLKDINKKFSEITLQDLFDELVPASGPADTKAGELVRAMMRILYRDYNDGDVFYEGYGLETCGPAACFIITHTDDSIYDAFIDIAQRVLEDSRYTAAIEKISDDLIEFILIEHPNLLTELNEEDSRHHDIDEIREFIPTYDLEFNYPDNLAAHLEKGNIDYRDIEWEIESWLDNYPYDRSDDERIDANDWGVTIEGIYRDAYEELDRNAYSWLEQWGDDLNDEYGDPTSLDLKSFDRSEVIAVLENILIDDYTNDEEAAEQVSELLYDYIEEQHDYFRDGVIDLSLYDNLKSFCRDFIKYFPIEDCEYFGAEAAFAEKVLTKKHHIDEDDEIEEQLLEADNDEKFKYDYNGTTIILPEIEDDDEILEAYCQIIDDLIYDNYFDEGEIKTFEVIEIENAEYYDEYYKITTKDGKQNGNYQYIGGRLYYYELMNESSFKETFTGYTTKDAEQIKKALEKNHIRNVNVVISNDGFSIDIDFPDITPIAEKFYRYLVNHGIDCDLHDEDDFSWIVIYSGEDLNKLN